MAKDIDILEPVPIMDEIKVDDKDEKEVEKEDYTGLVSQVKKEYKVAYDFMKPKIDKWRMRLKLYNNQKRDDEAVGDTTLFTIFQTVLASLYDDRLAVEFGGREDGDEETADNLTAMAKADYDDMEKDQLDFEWDWDTLFFGRGLMLMEEFDREPDKNVFVPVPEVLDPLTFLRDPRATSVNGNKKGKGAMRFGGSEIKMTIEDIKNHPNFFKDIDFSKLKYGESTQSLVADASQSRDEAQGRQNPNKDTESDLGANAEYDVTQWFTHWKKSDGSVVKVKMWLGNERNTLLGIKELERDYWPIIDRPLYPTAHDWDGTSIPDLIEDKQRARAIAQNLGLKAMKADIYPMYIYNTNKITNRADLNFDFDKFIGVDTKPGESTADAVVPMRKSAPNMGMIDFIYQSLDASAQKATATPELQQGAISSQQRTLGELNLVASNVDTRYSLSAKVFGWSEKRFWYHWYNMYKDNFAENIDEKVLRTVGAFGAKWRTLSKDDIVANIDPDIMIESQVVSRAKELEEMQKLNGFFAIAFSDPTVNRRWGMKKLARLNGLEKDEIDRLFPPTIDERIAEDQNELLNQNKIVPVLPEDDHNIHLEIHAKAKETEASKAHIETHKKALSIKKVKPELFPAEQQPQMGMGDGTQPNGQPGVIEQTPIQPVTPSQTSNQAGRSMPTMQ